MDKAPQGGHEIFVYTGGKQAVPEDVVRVRIEKSVTIIPERAFYGRANLVYIEFHDGVIIIKNWAFANCTSLRQVNLLGVKVIEYRAFDGSGITDVCGDKVETIQRLAFKHCTKLKNATFPSVRTIGEDAFTNCYKLESVIFGEALERIPQGTFGNCPDLRCITIPFFKDDGMIDYGVFTNSPNLTTVNLVGKGIQQIHKTISSLQNESRRNEMVAEVGSINRILPATHSSEKGAAIKRWIKSVYRKLEEFKDQHGTLLEEEIAPLFLAIGLPSNSIAYVTSFLTLDFVYDGKHGVPMDVRRVTIHPSVTIIPRMAFQNRRKLEYVQFHKRVEIVETCAFEYCESLHLIKNMSGVREVEYKAFYCCKALRELQMPAIERIGQTAFAHCPLRRINLPSIEVVGMEAFYHCRQLLGAEFGPGLKDIQSGAFNGCTFLRRITMPITNNPDIGDHAFNCPNLTAFVWGEDSETDEKKAAIIRLVLNQVERCRNERDGMLLQQPESSNLGDCPICYLPLSLDPEQSTMMACCSKLICNGCEFANQMREAGRFRGQECPFCRHQAPETDKDIEENRMKRVEMNDPAAMCQMGEYRYHKGDYRGAFEYWMTAAGLGNVKAHYQLGILYRTGKGVEKDEKHGLCHFEEAAIGGHVRARRMLAAIEWRDGRRDRAVKHYIIAATLGDDGSIKALREDFKRGLISKEDYAAVLRAHQAAVDATKSPQREAAEVALRKQEANTRRKYGKGENSGQSGQTYPS
jgi:hypothetical protein